MSTYGYQKHSKAVENTGRNSFSTLANSRGERIAKYNRFLEIEHELGPKARYAGASVYERWHKPVKA